MPMLRSPIVHHRSLIESLTMISTRSCWMMESTRSIVDYWYDNCTMKRMCTVEDDIHEYALDRIENRFENFEQMLIGNHDNEWHRSVDWKSNREWRTDGIDRPTRQMNKKDRKGWNDEEIIGWFLFCKTRLITTSKKDLVLRHAKAEKYHPKERANLAVQRADPCRFVVD